MKILYLIVLVTLLAVSGCKKEKKEHTDIKKETSAENSVKKLEINLVAKNESDVSGSIIFIEEEGMVSMEASLTGLSEGEHAIHIHEKSDCSSPDGKSAGGHWNPTKQPHGKWGAKEGFHKGDIGNIKADSEGNASIIFATNDWCIGCDDKKKNIIGRAIIVHQGVDDFTTQPTGAAGSRVSCGGIIQ